MKYLNIVVLLFFAFILASCGHTNELAKFDVHNSQILFRQKVSPNARTIKIEKFQQADSKEENKGLTGILNTVAKLGTDILASDKQAKLKKVINTKVLLSSITQNLVESMVTYLEIIPVNNMSDNPHFICTTNLQDCKLLVDQNNVSIYVNATATLVEKATGQIAWENYESKTISLNESYEENSSNTGLESVLTALKLVSLNEDEINEIVDAAADDVGTYMAETLRDDVAKAHQQRLEINKKE